METRTRKIQAKTTVTGNIGSRITRTVPALELSGNWFIAAGFTPGQMVSIVCDNGTIYIRKALLKIEDLKLGDRVRYDDGMDVDRYEFEVVGIHASHTEIEVTWKGHLTILVKSDFDKGYVSRI